MVLAERFRLLMLVCHRGSLCDKSSIQPSKLMSKSPVVEVIKRSGTVSLSPCPSMADETERVLLKVFKEGRKHVKSESVILDRRMLPR